MFFLNQLLFVPKDDQKRFQIYYNIYGVIRYALSKFVKYIRGVQNISPVMNTQGSLDSVVNLLPSSTRKFLLYTDFGQLPGGEYSGEVVNTLASKLQIQVTSGPFHKILSPQSLSTGTRRNCLTGSLTVKKNFTKLSLQGNGFRQVLKIPYIISNF